MAVISIDGTGLAHGKFCAANYSFTVSGKGKTGPKAKLATRAIQEKLFRAMKDLQKNGVVIVPGKTCSTLTVEKDYGHNSSLGRFFSGYTATFSMTFRSRDLDRIAEIHDALTSIEGAEVASPQFLMDPSHKEELRKIAFESAVKQARQRFEDQCSVVGHDPEVYKIINWQSKTGRNTLSNFKGMNATYNPMSNDEDFFIAVRSSVEPGEARVELTLVIDFDKKAD